MRFVRGWTVLLILLPSAAVASPRCDDRPEAECCDTDGDCPLAPSGECAWN